jgi:hypothetical protein
MGLSGKIKTKETELYSYFLYKCAVWIPSEEYIMTCGHALWYSDKFAASVL